VSLSNLARSNKNTLLDFFRKEKRKMSNLVSNFIQTKKVGSSTKKAILMYMADKASDDGSGVWVSKKNMCADLELSVRALQINIKLLLMYEFLIESGRKKCKNGYTIDYTINLEAFNICKSTRQTPALDAPPQEMHPSPRTSCTPTPASDAPKPPLEPSLEPIISVKDILNDWLKDKKAADSFVAYRKSIKKPLTKTGAKRLATALRHIFVAGGSPEDALAMCEEKGWKSIEPEWYFNTLHGKDSVRFKQAMDTLR